MADKVLRPDRAGMKTIVTYLPVETARAVKVIAAQQGRTMQEIGEQALMEWLEKHDRSATKPK